MLDNMVHNKRVVVADLDDINDNIGRLKVCIAPNHTFSKTSSEGPVVMKVGLALRTNTQPKGLPRDLVS